MKSPWFFMDATLQGGFVFMTSDEYNDMKGRMIQLEHDLNWSKDNYRNLLELFREKTGYTYEDSGTI